jgi:antitoxin MazE
MMISPEQTCFHWHSEASLAGLVAIEIVGHFGAKCISKKMYLHLEATMHIARWGNSLAVRIPAKTVKALALKEGDEVQVDLKLVEAARTERETLRTEAIERLRNMPRFVSPDFKFDRDEANER